MSLEATKKKSAAKKKVAVQFEGEPVSQASLLAHGTELDQKQVASVRRVNEMVQSQKDLSQDLSTSLQAMQSHGQHLDEMQLRANEKGLMASLARTFNRRRTILERRSIAEDLLRHYEVANVNLRRGSAFSDELRLCALEMQQSVDELHEEHARSRRNAKLAAQRILEIEKKVAQIGAEAGANVNNPMAAAAREIDALRFEERTLSTSLELYRANAELCAQELGPARSLRDTVLALHEDMARFVLNATSSVNSAGRRIQALGMAADAPIVVSELQASLKQLDTAMETTTLYIDHAQDLLTRILPEISAQIEQQSASRSWMVSSELDDFQGSRARALADRELQEAADAEIAALSNKTL